MFLTEIDGRGTKGVVGACTREVQLSARHCEAAALAAPEVVSASPRARVQLARTLDTTPPRETDEGKM